jgi:hypothetical protein
MTALASETAVWNMIDVRTLIQMLGVFIAQVTSKLSSIGSNSANRTQLVIRVLDRA